MTKKRLRSPAQLERKRQKDREWYFANRTERLAKQRDRHHALAQQPTLCFERARELLSYDAETGALTCRVDRGSLKAGSIAGTDRHDGYRSLFIDGRMYAGHRVAWLLVHGAWPQGEIDHIDGDPSNNRIQNLRDVSPSVNQQNMRRPRANKKYSPLIGAQWCKRTERWKTAIRVDGRTRHLGFFSSDVEASAAYIAAKRLLHEGCTI